MNLKKYILIISILLIIIGFTINVKLKYNEYKIQKQKHRNIINFIEQKNSSEYIALLEIPKLSFKRGIKPNLTVDEDIIILNYNYIPDGNIMIAGHSGNCSACHFNSLDKLKEKDLLYFYYNGIKYIYDISNIEVKEKNSFVISNESNTITLITCVKDSDHLQIIITGKLIRKEKY